MILYSNITSKEFKYHSLEKLLKTTQKYIGNSLVVINI